MIRVGAVLVAATIVAGLPWAARGADGGESQPHLADVFSAERTWLQVQVGPSFGSGGGSALMVSPRVGLETLPGNTKFRVLAYVPVTFTFSGTELDGTRVSATGVAFGLGGRLRLLLHPVVHPYIDMSLGVAVAWASVEIPFQGWKTASATGPFFGFAAGVELPLDERLALYLEPLGVTASGPDSGSGPQFSMLVGLGYRLGGTSE